ncbi:hypothetical protein EVAR_98854_1 [Eumeta japonica]|uniref:Uncharacterized protein n=1 Tax=Eumeta variegata TaxID=151549 RepID=A0A4C1Z9B5_EUMVA|nr:hypothetical protein EVAR_98854_1 [Eumeta japonica]
MARIEPGTSRFEGDALSHGAAAALFHSHPRSPTQNVNSRENNFHRRKVHRPRLRSRFEEPSDADWKIRLYETTSSKCCAVLILCVGGAADDGDVMKFDSAAPAHAASTAPAPTLDMEQFRLLPDLSKQEQRSWSPAEAARCDGRDGRRLCIVFDGALYDVTDFAHLVNFNSSLTDNPHLNILH